MTEFPAKTDLPRLTYQPAAAPPSALFIAETGFGFGFRHTLGPAIRGAPGVETPEGTGHLVRILDEVSKTQGDLANARNWEPTAPVMGFLELRR